MSMLVVLYCSVLNFFQIANDSTVFDIRYQNAYNYLNSKKQLKRVDKTFKKLHSGSYPINVVPEIYPVSLMMLNENVIVSEVMPDTSDKSQWSRFIMDYDNENYFQPYREAEFIKKFSFNGRSQIYVLFSKMIGNLLLAEIHLDYYNKVPQSNNELPSVGAFYKVLFVFEGNDVKRFFSNKVNR